MERALVYVILMFVAGIVTAVFVRHARPAATVIISILMYIPSYCVWFGLQYFQIVPVDALLRQTFGVDSYQLVGTPLGTLVLLGPPLLPSIVLLGWFFLVRRRRSPA